MLETELPVELVSVTRGEDPTAEALEIRMQHHALDQPLPKSLAAMRLKYKNVPKVADGGEIRDNASKTDLFVALQQNEVQRMLDRLAYHRQRNPLVRIVEKPCDDVEVGSASVASHTVFTAVPFHFVCCGSASHWVRA
jgi:hypothetical protein